jgi:hypothetical protein
MTSEETGIEFLRRVASASEHVGESTFDGLTPEQCLRLFRAVWASGWDIYPDELTRGEICYGAEHGILSESCLARLEKQYA